MNQTVENFIESHKLIEPSDHILIAVSGGVDSMALLHYISHHYSNPITVAHVEHGLRGEESRKDMEFVKKHCTTNDIPFYYFQPNVAAYKKEYGLSTQEAARQCRYDWFALLMAELQVDKIALAHHGDDQIETVLMRQVRGSFKGLQGIPVKRKFAEGLIIRPFLCVDKKEIKDYCVENGIVFREDESNKEDTYQRNRFRKKVLPFLKEENPKVHQSFQRHSEWLMDDERFLQSMAEEQVNSAIIEKSLNGIRLSIKEMCKLPTPLQRRGLHLILNYLSPDGQRDFTSKHIEDTIELMKKDYPSGLVHLPKGIIVEKAYDDCRIFFEAKEEMPERKEIPIPGIVLWKKGKITSTLDSKGKTVTKGDAVFRGDKKELRLPLYIRTREKGDRISPIGLNGTKKLKDLFIDEKIPRRERDTWPIVTDKEGNILWVPLLKRSNFAPVTNDTEEEVTLVFHMGDKKS